MYRNSKKKKRKPAKKKKNPKKIFTNHCNTGIICLYHDLFGFDSLLNDIVQVSNGPWASFFFKILKDTLYDILFNMHNTWFHCSLESFRIAKVVMSGFIFQSYLESLTTDEKSMSRVIQTLPHSHFTMVHELQSTIERDSQAVVDFSKENSHVFIFGKKENVSIAQVLIDRMVKKEDNIAPYIDIRLHGEEGHDKKGIKERSKISSKNNGKDDVHLVNKKGNFTSGDVTENSGLFGSNLCTSESAISVSNLTGPTGKKTPLRTHAALKRTVSVGASPLPPTLTAPTENRLAKTKSYGSEVKNSFSNLKITQQSSTSSEDETTDEEEYNTKIEFALKLGYSELQLASVLRKLGNKAGQNEILSELIKLSTSTEKVCKNSDESNSSLCSMEGSAENLLAFTAENCFVLSDSTSNFRPIVIDGSNVAMRLVNYLLNIHFANILHISVVFSKNEVIFGWKRGSGVLSIYMPCVQLSESFNWWEFA